MDIVFTILKRSICKEWETDELICSQGKSEMIYELNNQIK